jgi:ribonuclease HII
VKKSFKTIRTIENKKGKALKIVPPIREDLLTEEFVNTFNEGRLSIKAMSLICPGCGHILKSISMAIFKQNGKYVSRLKCPEDNCNNFIEDASLTLRYFCGYIVPDSNAIFRSMLSNDLKASKLFEDFSVILCPVVRKECDGTNRGKKEFQELRKYHSIGRIKLESPGKIEEIPDNLPNEIRDERIIETCLDYNAILLTADKSMSAFSVGKGVFTISV